MMLINNKIIPPNKENNILFIWGAFYLSAVNCNFSLSKPQNNFISDCIVGMIKAESVVTTDIIKKLPRDYFDESLFSSKEFYIFTIYFKIRKI